jgi:predicted transcriptional regulator
LSSSLHKNSVQWRRTKVLELASQGRNQLEIAKLLQINQSTISRDLSILRQEAKQNIKRYIDERLPEEYEKCMVGLNSILTEAWNTSYQAQDKREKLQALSLAKECYAMKLELLTNATVVDDAIRFVSERSNNNKKSVIQPEDKEELISNQVY